MFAVEDKQEGIDMNEFKKAVLRHYIDYGFSEFCDLPPVKKIIFIRKYYLENFEAFCDEIVNDDDALKFISTIILGDSASAVNLRSYFKQKQLNSHSNVEQLFDQEMESCKRIIGE